MLYSSLRHNSRFWVYQDHEPVNIEGLEKAGFLRPTAPADYYTCECEHGGGEVYWSHSLGQEYAHVRCGCGTYRIDPQEIQQWEFVFSEFLNKVGTAMGFPLPFQEICPGLVWKLGRRKRREFYYLRCADFDLRRSLREMFTPHPKAVLILPSPECMEFLDTLPNLMFAVENIGQLDSGFSLTIDMTAIDTELEAALPDKKPVRVKRGSRAASIEKLVAELKEYYRASKDNFYENGSLLGNLTQESLGKLAGLSQREVSRCLADPDAVMLRLLWKKMGDEQAILHA